jgi:hypothetical protein
VARCPARPPHAHPRRRGTPRPQPPQLHACLALSRLAALLRFETEEARAAAAAAPPLARLLAAVRAAAPRLGGGQLSMALTSLAFLQHSVAPPPGLLAALAVRLPGVLDESEPDDICNCLWALSKLGADCAPALAAASAHALAAGWLRQLPAKPLCGLLWVHARAAAGAADAAAASSGRGGARTAAVVWESGPVLPRLLDAAMAEVAAPGFLETFAPQELSMLLWSLATISDAAAALAAAPAAEASAAGAATRAALRCALPLGLLGRVAAVAAERVVSFTPQGVANSCWAVSKLAPGALAPPPQRQQQQQQQEEGDASADGAAQLADGARRLLSAFLDAAAAQLEYYKPQEVTNLLGAMARMRAPHAPLLAAARGYLRTRSHLLAAWDVEDALTSLLRLGSPPEPALLQRLSHRAAQLAGGMPAHALARCAWGLARAGGDAVPLVRAAAARLGGGSGSGGSGGTPEAWAPHDVALVLWAATAARRIAAAPQQAPARGRARGAQQQGQQRQAEAAAAAAQSQLAPAAQAALLARLPACDSHTLTQALTALAGAQAQGGANASGGDAFGAASGGFVAAAAARLAEQAARMAPVHAAAAARAAVQLSGRGGSAARAPAAALLAAALDAVTVRGAWQQLPPASAADLLWAANAAAARGARLPAGQLSQLLRAVVSHAHSLSPADLATVCAAAASTLLRARRAAPAPAQGDEQQQQQAAAAAAAEHAELCAAAAAAHNAACDRMLDTIEAWVRRGGGADGAAELRSSHLAAAVASCVRLGTPRPPLLAAAQAAWEELLDAGCADAPAATALLWALGRGGRGAAPHSVEAAARLLAGQLARGGGGDALERDASTAALALEAFALLRYQPQAPLAAALQQRVAAAAVRAHAARVRRPRAALRAARAAAGALHHVAVLGLDAQPLLDAIAPALLAHMPWRPVTAAPAAAAQQAQQQQQRKRRRRCAPCLGAGHCLRVLWAICATGARGGRAGRVAAAVVFRRMGAARLACDPHAARMLLDCRLALKSGRPRAWAAARGGWRRLRACGAPRRPADGAAPAARALRDAEVAASRALAAELVTAGLAPAAAGLAWQQLPNGDAFAALPPHCGAVVVFDGPRHRCANGGAPTGAALLRNRALAARGLRVLPLPLRLWAGGAGAAPEEHQREAAQRRAAAERVAAAAAAAP